jgi:acylphosphatase
MSQLPPASLHAVVRGRVQGVGFRDFVMTRARSLGLRGYARNLPDGRSVEVVAEGPRSELDRLVEDLVQGPRSARVESVETHWSPATGLHRDFGARF